MPRERGTTDPSSDQPPPIISPCSGEPTQAPTSVHVAPTFSVRRDVGIQFTSNRPRLQSLSVGCGATGTWLNSPRIRSTRRDGTIRVGSVGRVFARAPNVLEKPRAVPKPKRIAEPLKPVIDPYFRLCPYAMLGQCRFGDKCAYVHGVLCDLCGFFCLDPNNPQQREFHTNECERVHEQDMKHSFQLANSADKTCGICYDVVLNKEGNKNERRFGILSSCTHVFCLTCIRQWRRQNSCIVNRLTTRTCPACRKPADFVIPSKFWVDDPVEKDEMIKAYKQNMQKKHCKYFARGSKPCPFGNKCFYKHELRDGTRVDVGPPKKRKDDVEEQAMFQQMLMWDFMDQRELRAAYLLELQVMRSVAHPTNEDYDGSAEYPGWDFDDVADYLAYEQSMLGNSI